MTASQAAGVLASVPSEALSSSVSVVLAVEAVSLELVVLWLESSPGRLLRRVQAGKVAVLDLLPPHEQNRSTLQGNDLRLAHLRAPKAKRMDRTAILVHSNIRSSIRCPDEVAGPAIFKHTTRRIRDITLVHRHTHTGKTTRMSASPAGACCLSSASTANEGRGAHPSA